MRAFLLLLRSYFFGTRLGSWLTFSGIAFSILTVILESQREQVLALRGELLLFCPLLANQCIFFGSASMPTIVAALARSDRLSMLPNGRVTLLLSALAAVSLVTAASAAIVTLLYVGLPMDLTTVFKRAVTVIFFTYSVVYLILWLIAALRSTAAVLGGAMLIIATLTLPLYFIAAPSSPLRWAIAGAALVWIPSAALLLGGPRSIAWLRRFAPTSNLPWTSGARRSPPGRELDQMLNLGHPLLLAFGQVVPIAAAIYFIDHDVLWIFYFTLFSALSGALSSLAPARSRRLWLKVGLTRGELFRQVERICWRQTGSSLAMLLLLFGAIAIHRNLPRELIAGGLVLIALATSVSTYLGLAITRELKMQELALGLGLMLWLMAIAIGLTASSIDWWTTTVLLILLAGSLPMLRRFALFRWRSLDWADCRDARPRRPHAA